MLSTYFSSTFNLFTHFYKLTNSTQPPKDPIKYPMLSSMWMSHKPKFQLEITSWNRDVHGLFDFQGGGSYYNTTKHQISDNCQIFRNTIQNQTYLNSTMRQLPNYFDYVCSVQKTHKQGDHCFWLKWNPPQRKSLSKKQIKVQRNPCIVLDSFKVNNIDENQEFEGYPLQVGEVIKFGLISFMVRELKDDRSLNSVQQLFKNHQSMKNQIFNLKDSLSTNSQESLYDKVKKQSEQDENEIDDSHTKAKKRTIQKDTKRKPRKKGDRTKKQMRQESFSSDYNSNNEKEEHRISQRNSEEEEQERQFGEKKENIKQECKFCLMEDYSTDNDPFISPCQCKGSVEKVHLTCFMEWISSKLSITEKNQVKTYRLQRNHCEVCKIPYPETIQYGNNFINLIDIKRSSQPYLLMQKVSEKEGNLDSTFVMIPGAENKSISVGRADDNDIKLSDISVSRHHSEFFYKKGRFYLKDLKSKFGTLVKFEKDRLFDFSPAKIQIGRIFYKISPLLNNGEESSQSCKSESE